MATEVWCPTCKSEQPCQKKGKNARGIQRWLCKTCGKRFLEEETNRSNTQKAPVKTTTSVKTTKASGKSAKKPAAKKKAITPNKNIKTVIKVNNANAKTVNGEHLSIDEAGKLVAAYYREVTKGSATESIKNGVKTITFKVRTGTKG